MFLRWQNIVIDQVTDTILVASFWSEALGLELHGPEDGEYWIEPGGESPDILFLHVPEGKSVKDRIHLDLRLDDQDAEVERLPSLGARKIDIGQQERSPGCSMADPEANEFCVLSSRAPATS